MPFVSISFGNRWLPGRSRMSVAKVSYRKIICPASNRHQQKPAPRRLLLTVNF